ncbi:hypothetical protein ACH4UY_37670 [Streptomyces longwoodensis]|uniref:hypothetical protein n=1 Tax=Streptomyces longwoodensis TaxID=68231 RepID=UPI0037AD0F1A
MRAVKQAAALELLGMLEERQETAEHGWVRDMDGAPHEGVLKAAASVLTAGWNSIAAPIIWDGAIWGAVLLLKPMDVMPEAPQHYIYATISAVARLGQIGGV